MNNMNKQGSLISELTISPRNLGKIRLGMKVPTTATKANPMAMKIYNEGVENGLPSKDIEATIDLKCGIKNPLRPENKEYFSIRVSDFNDPTQYHKILEMYGEDRGDGIKIYSLPIAFPFNDIEKIMPNRFAAWKASRSEFFSEYEGSVRLCKKFSEPQKSPTSTRAVRTFGQAKKEIRIDKFINGVCDPNACPQYQNKKCNLDLSLIFSIPGIKGAGVFSAHSNSISSLKNWYAVLSLVNLCKGSLRNVEFTLIKSLRTINYISPEGTVEKSKQWITEITSDLDIVLSMNLEHDGEVHEIKQLGLNTISNIDDSYSNEHVIIDEPQSSMNASNFNIELHKYFQTVDLSSESELAKSNKKLKAFLKFHKISLDEFQEYAIQKHCVDWNSHIDIVDSELKLISQMKISAIFQMLTDMIH